jgi:hypothetical protein
MSVEKRMCRSHPLFAFNGWSPSFGLKPQHRPERRIAHGAARWPSPFGSASFGPSPCGRFAERPSLRSDPTGLGEAGCAHPHPRRTPAEGIRTWRGRATPVERRSVVARPAPCARDAARRAGCPFGPAGEAGLSPNPKGLSRAAQGIRASPCPLSRRPSVAPEDGSARDDQRVGGTRSAS